MNTKSILKKITEVILILGVFTLLVKMVSSFFDTLKKEKKGDSWYE